MANTFAFEGGSGAGSMINSLDSDGFTLGNSAVVNANGIGYHYVLFNEVPGAIEASDYDGANNTGQTITGVGFQPDYVMMRGDANDSGHHRPASLGGAASLFYTGTANTTDGITSLTSDGFTVGGIDQVNKNGVNHYYLALKNTDGGSSLFSTQSVTANQDSWVQQASPTDTKGSDSKLVVSSESSNKNVRGLVQFSPLPSTPGGFTMKHSQMYLNNEQSGATAANRTIEAYRAATTWAEATVNWNTKPASAGTAATALTLSTAGFIGWNVTSLVSDMYSGSNFGFILRDQVEDSATKREQLFTSSEGTASNHPRLDVTFGN